MSISTISTVNKYLLSKTETAPPPPPPLTEYTFTGQFFPASWTGLSSAMSGYDTATTELEFQPPTQNVWWKDQTGFKISTSTTGSWGATYYPIKSLFDGNYNTFFGTAFFTNRPYNQPGDYIGSNGAMAGGTGGGGLIRESEADAFFTTIYNTSQNVNGEYIEFKFPFKIKLRSISLSPRRNLQTWCPENITVVGSDDGTTWNFIGNVTFTSIPNDTMQSKNISTTSKYHYIRLVVRSVLGPGNAVGFTINASELSLYFDVFAYQ